VVIFRFKWLSGIAPACVAIQCRESASHYKTLERQLTALGFESAMEQNILGVCSSIVLGSANTIMALRFQYPNVVEIETAFPTMGHIDVFPRHIRVCLARSF
jgi:hypothetical protein